MREADRMRMNAVNGGGAAFSSVTDWIETKPANPPSKADGLIQMLIDQGVTDQTIFEKVRGTFSEDECRQLMNAFIEATGCWY